MEENTISEVRSLKTATDPQIRSAVVIVVRRHFINRRDRVVPNAVIHAEASSRVGRALVRSISRIAARLVLHVVRRCIAADLAGRKTSAVRARMRNSMDRAGLSLVFNRISAAPARSSLEHAKAGVVLAVRRTLIAP